MEYLYTHLYASPAGPLYLAVDRSGGVHRVAYHDFRKELVPGTFEDNKYACGEIEFQLDEYFRGAREQFTLRVNLQGTGFQQSVWTTLQRIAYGHTVTYGELARRIGRRGAARAVGNAVGSNPAAVVIPCHRVVRASGERGNYARRILPAEEGRRIKEHLLGLEQGPSSRGHPH